MKTSKGIQSFLDEAKKKDSYWVEKAKLDFSLGLERQRRAGGLTYAAIAKAIGTSAAYITKIFRGDSNVTIETMVKLARATGGELNIEIVHPVKDIRRWEATHFPAIVKNVAPKTTQTATVYAFPEAANKSDFQWKVAA